MLVGYGFGMFGLFDLPYIHFFTTFPGVQQAMLRVQQAMLRVQQAMLRVQQAMLRVQQAMLQVQQAMLQVQQAMLREINNKAKLSPAELELGLSLATKNINY